MTTHLTHLMDKKKQYQSEIVKHTVEIALLKSQIEVLTKSIAHHRRLKQNKSGGVSK
jgi:hypothetical protein